MNKEEREKMREEIEKWFAEKCVAPEVKDKLSAFRNWDDEECLFGDEEDEDFTFTMRDLRELLTKLEDVVGEKNKNLPPNYKLNEICDKDWDDCTYTADDVRKQEENIFSRLFRRSLGGNNGHKDR